VSSGGGARPVAIYRLLKVNVFAPDDIKVLSDAFETALRELKLVGLADAPAELVAKRIIDPRSATYALRTAFFAEHSNPDGILSCRG
jgi:hypothetical protein